MHQTKQEDMKRNIAIVLAAFAPVALAFAQTETVDTIGAQKLDEIIVKGEKPQIKGKDGIMVVDLPAIVEDKPVTNVLEALGYLPGVVDNDGAIGLNGAASVTIIINGEPTAMPVQNLYQLLYSTPVERLANVEIMYSAPAKYHVNGAVINVVLKTPRPLDGLMGQATIGGDQSHYVSGSGGVSATYAVKDWTFDLNWTLSRNHSYKRQQTSSSHLLDGTRHKIDDDMRQIGQDWTNVLHAAVAYKELKLSYDTQVASHINNRSVSSGTFGDFVNYHKGVSPSSYNSVAVRYSSPQGLTLGGEYTNYYEHRSQNLLKGAHEQLRAENRQNINRFHAYADKEHVLGNWTVGYGLDYLHSDDKSCQAYIFPVRPGFDNTLREDVGSAYVATAASLPWGLSFNASVKAEYFHNDRRNDWNIVPQLGATYYKTPTSIFQLNYTSDRVYPSYWELHGGTAYVNDYSMILGNPALQPYLNHTCQLSYIFKQKYAATFYVLYADDYFVQLPYQSTSDLHLIFQTQNIDFSKTVGLQLHVPFDVGDIWRATATLNISHKQEKSCRFHDLAFNNKRWGAYASLENTIRLGAGSPISLSIGISYIGGQIQGPGRFDPLWKVDAGVKWQFGKKRCCELTLKANDIFNTCNPDMKINFSGQDYRMKASEMNRNLKLTFVWRFNGFKPKDTGIDTSRFGTGS